MHRVEAPYVDLVGGTNRFKATPPYSVPGPEWFNAVQEELMNAITGFSFPVLDSNSDSFTQLLEVLQSIQNTFTLPRGHLYGLTLSNNVTDPTNDIDIAIGNCIDSTNSEEMIISSSLTKRLDAAWAVGTNQGGLDTGAIANTTYHVYVIKRTDTGVVDTIFSASASAPTMPANYTYYRRIGSFYRTGGSIILFKQRGDVFVLDQIQTQSANLSDTQTTITLPVPTGLEIQAFGELTGGVHIVSPTSIILQSYLASNQLPVDIRLTNSIGVAGSFNSGVYEYTSGSYFKLLVNSSAQLWWRCSAVAGWVSAAFYPSVQTWGWIDTRGRVA